MSKENKEKRYRYRLVKKDGTTEAWTGPFKTLMDAKEWLKTHGEWWKKNHNKKFKLFISNNNEDE